MIVTPNFFDFEENNKGLDKTSIDFCNALQSDVIKRLDKLTHFTSFFHFCTPWKRHKTKNFQKLRMKRSSMFLPSRYLPAQNEQQKH